MKNSGDGCIAFILEWLKLIPARDLQSPSSSPPSDSPFTSPRPDPVGVPDQPSSSTSFSAPGNERMDYDIFLSFRGADTRHGFTGYLYRELCNMSLKTFMDNEDLKKGEKIEELLGYIETSKVFVPIISKGYAESKWCLKEITKIVECAGGRLILPIFFGVEPSDVRHQTGPFEPAFEKYVKDRNMDKTEVEKWRHALKQVSELSGYSLANQARGHEPILLDKVVRHLVRHLDRGFLKVADHPIGMESRVEEVMKRLRIGEGGIAKVGIVGTGGIGKTTIAKAVFNKLRLDFGASTFLKNIRESWEASDSQMKLMRQYCQQILNNKSATINNADDGRRLLSEKAPSKKVLIVLDDVDSHADQFNELKSLSFAPGSCIIITTRDESVVLGFGVNKENVYKPRLLETDQSLALFNRYAFPNTQEPQDIYLHMSEKVAALAGGLPLALKVFGSYLSGKPDLEEWEEYVDKLQSTPDPEILKRLQISYDGLSTEDVNNQG